LKICNFYLLRHGKVEGDAALNGHTDRKVAPMLQQKISDALSRQAIQFEHIITSPLSRCADLAALLHNGRPQLKLTNNDQLRELSFGTLDGKAFDSIKDQWPLLDAFWQNPAKNTLPRAETLHAFNQRVTAAWSELIETQSEDTLIVTHGGVIRMILADVLQLDWKNPAWHANLAIGNASLTHIQVTKADKNYISVKSIAVELC
jgi:alpha-ribazole phosphatase